MKSKEWTIMIYMAGDNNLAVDMAYAMEQIKEVAGEGAENRNVLVYYDGNSPQIPTLYCDFSDPQAQYVPSATVSDKLYPVPRKWNENAADVKSVKNFVDWCVNTRGRRANRYALIFSGHSLGFLDKGLFKDETTGKTMKIGDLFSLIQRLILPQECLDEIAHDEGLEGEEKARETTTLLGQHLDILGFDSCVMGMLEVGYQFQDLTRTMIVSEGSVPSAGWSYAKILGGLCGCKHSTKEIAANFVKEFIRGQDRFIVGGVTVDMAAWDLGECGFNELADAFDGLSQALLDCFQDEGSRIYKQMERAILQVHWKCQSYMYDQNVDLGDFCHLLQEECKSVAAELGNGEGLEMLQEVQECCQRVIGELEKIVLLSGFSGGGYQYSNGVSVFFPWSWEGYLVSRENYESLFFSKDRKNGNFDANWKGWADFLKLYLSEVTFRKAAPLTPDAPLGAKYRYRSGLLFEEGSSALPLSGSETPLTKMANSQTSKMANSQTSKMANSQTSKMANSQTSKMANSQTSKMANSQTSKMGGGQDTLFEALKLWKNIESRFDISGFTKRPDETEPEATGAYDSSY